MDNYENLNRENKKSLWSNIRQVIIAYVMVFISMTIVLGGLYFILYEISDIPEIDSNIVLFRIITILCFIVFMIFFMRSIRPGLLDLRGGEKRIRYEIIKDKYTEDKTTVSKNPLANSGHQTIFNEYYIDFGEFKIQVSKADYNSFDINSEVKLSISTNTNMVIQIESVKPV